MGVQELKITDFLPDRATAHEHSPMTRGRYRAIMLRAARRHDGLTMFRYASKQAAPGFYREQATRTERSYYRPQA